MLTLPNCQHKSLFEILEFLSYIGKDPQKNDQEKNKVVLSDTLIFSLIIKIVMQNLPAIINSAFHYFSIFKCRYIDLLVNTV